MVNFDAIFEQQNKIISRQLRMIDIVTKPYVNFQLSVKPTIDAINEMVEKSMEPFHTSVAIMLEDIKLMQKNIIDTSGISEIAKNAVEKFESININDFNYTLPTPTLKFTEYIGVINNGLTDIDPDSPELEPILSDYNNLVESTDTSPTSCNQKISLYDWIMLAIAIIQIIIALLALPNSSNHEDEYLKVLNDINYKLEQIVDSTE